jgi:hypothetical protein
LNCDQRLLHVSPHPVGFRFRDPAPPNGFRFSRGHSPAAALRRLDCAPSVPPARALTCSGASFVAWSEVQRIRARLHAL